MRKGYKHIMDLIWGDYLVKTVRSKDYAPPEYKIPIPMICYTGKEPTCIVPEKPCLVFRRENIKYKWIEAGENVITMRWNYKFIGGDYL